MYKTLLLLVPIRVLTASCSEPVATASTLTPVPSYTPTSTTFEPQQVNELELETRTGTSYTLDWSHDGETLAAGSGYEITLLDKDLSRTPVVLKPEIGALGVTWSPDEDQLATINGYRNPKITIWDLDRKNDQLVQVRQLDGGADQYGVSWSPDGKLLATLGDDDNTTIQIWDTGSWDEIDKYELPYSYPRRALHWSADSTTLYEAGEANGQAVVFTLSVSDGTVRELGKFAVDELFALAVSPDEKTIAIADERGIVQFIDIASGTALTAIKTVDQPVDLVWNPDGRRLAILGYKTALQLWEVSQ